MIISAWLRDVGSACGVADDGTWTREAAAECLRGGADSARVEIAFLVLGAHALSLVYERTVMGRHSRRYRNGPITWKPLPAVS
jgi:hypothetical protein